ncbi:MAG TPA: AMP-binding protein [Candidatus Dormibacteraeota bacterium]|nr:AMP-binding protein [Candidatus Dormibacteraeota bacterium]
MATQQHNLTDYEETVRTFRLEVPERFNFARDVVGRWARDPDKLAMLWLGEDGTERRITFRAFDQRSDRVAAALQRLGVRPGDRVMVQLPRVPEWWEVLLGCFKAGAVAVPGTVLLTAKDIHYRTTMAEGVAYVTDAEGAARVDQVRDDCPSLRALIQVGGEPGGGWCDYEAELAAVDEPRPVDTASADPALIYFTSGTVGNPKMVLHTHASYPIGHVITGRFWLDLRPDDLHFNLSETGWAKAAWSSLFGPWNMGAALFVEDARGRFSASRTLDVLERYPITTFCAPPTAYRMLVLEDLSRRRFPSLRWCVGAGEPLNPEVIESWQRSTGLVIRDGYGQTETVLLCGNFPTLEVRPGSMGRPSPGFTVAVIDDDGRPLPPGAEGDIAVRVHPERPVGLFREYWRNPEATAACRRGDWYVTGDRAVADQDGYLWFVGRADDVIISAGYRIGPFEVESALVEHPAVAEAAVVGKADPMRGTIVKAFVVLAPGHVGSEGLTRELQEHVRRVTAAYKYPREIEYVAELPKTISGKIRRVELRARG